MTLLFQIKNNSGTLEIFKLVIYSNHFRMVPSGYRYPFISIRWLWFTVCVDAFSAIDGFSPQKERG